MYIIIKFRFIHGTVFFQSILCITSKLEVQFVHFRSKRRERGWGGGGGRDRDRELKKKKRKTVNKACLECFHRKWKRREIMEPKTN